MSFYLFPFSWDHLTGSKLTFSQSFVAYSFKSLQNSRNMFTKPLQCCFDDTLGSWGTFVGSVRAGLTHQTDQPDRILLQLWPYSDGAATENRTSCSDNVQDSDKGVVKECVEECVEEYVQEFLNARQCVVAERKPWHFRRGVTQGGAHSASYETDVFESSAMYVIVTPERIINCRGEGALDLTEHILMRRYYQQTETLDTLFYCCTDIGEVEPDENEYLLAITSSEISVISLNQGVITRSFPFTKIRTYQRDRMLTSTILIQVGRMKHGDRTYSFRVFKAGEFYEALKNQLGVIASLMKRNRTVQGTDLSKDVRYENDATVISQTGEKSQQNIENLSYDSENEFNSFSESESASYEDLGETAVDSSFSSYCTDIYPFFTNSFDSEFSYERLTSSIDRRSSAPETNIIYQDVDDNFREKHHSHYFTRRFTRIYTKPTFISYIEGGVEALKTVRRRHLSEPGFTDVEGSGVYSRPFDPELMRLGKQEDECKNERGYDVLNIRPKSLAE